MKVISNNDDIKTLKKMKLDQRLIDNATYVVNLLDAEYGENRDPLRDYGGYILLVETPEDIEDLPKYTGCKNLDEYTFEYVDKYNWGYDTLYFKGTEFGIMLYFLNDALASNNKLSLILKI